MSAISRRSALGTLVFGSIAAATACRKPSATKALLFAAASTEPPVRDVVARLKREEHLELEVAFGASSDLARQIRAGAPADLFLSADEVQLDGLVRDGFCAADAVRKLLGNTLVVIVPERSSLTLTSARDLVSVRRLATGDPRGVPLGVYAKAWLAREGVLDAVSSAIVPCADARAAVAAVESDAVDAAIVYSTDASRAHHARVALRIPEHDGPRITYGIARLKRATSAVATRAFDLICAPGSLETFRGYGFTTRA